MNGIVEPEQSVMEGDNQRAGKPLEWYTAFYYLAEQVRILTNGAINHKSLYALLGTEGRYLNHDNPLVRKRTAGALSRLIHSSKYVQDMQARYYQGVAAFHQASQEVCGVIFTVSDMDDAYLFRYLVETCWPDVRLGLSNEMQAWRNDINLMRVDQEIACLIQYLTVGKVHFSQDQEAFLMSVEFFDAMFHIMAFSHVDASLAHVLVDNYSTHVVMRDAESGQKRYQACLIKLSRQENKRSKRSSTVFEGYWMLDSQKPCVIGRYTDCDIIELSPQISRTHACIYYRDNKWIFEDLGSSCGSSVVRDDNKVVFDSLKSDGQRKTALEYGDYIVLADLSRYLFCLASL